MLFRLKDTMCSRWSHRGERARVFVFNYVSCHSSAKAVVEFIDRKVLFLINWLWSFPLSRNYSFLLLINTSLHVRYMLYTHQPPLLLSLCLSVCLSLGVSRSLVSVPVKKAEEGPQPTLISSFSFLLICGIRMILFKVLAELPDWEIWISQGLLSRSLSRSLVPTHTHTFSPLTNDLLGQRPVIQCREDPQTMWQTFSEWYQKFKKHTCNSLYLYFSVFIRQFITQSTVTLGQTQLKWGEQPPTLWVRFNI